MDIDQSKFYAPLANRGGTTTPAEMFTPEKKALWYKHFEKSCNLTSALNAISIARKTFYIHLEKDPYLKELYLETIERHADKIEQIMRESAELPGNQGFRDRIAWLKAHRDKFKDRVQLEQKIDKKGLLELYNQLPPNLRSKGDKQRIIDAEVISEENGA